MQISTLKFVIKKDCLNHILPNIEVEIDYFIWSNKTTSAFVLDQNKMSWDTSHCLARCHKGSPSSFEFKHANDETKAHITNNYLSYIPHQYSFIWFRPENAY